MKKIIYKHETGIGSITPTNRFFNKVYATLKMLPESKSLTDDQIKDLVYETVAQKDVPAGCEYKIIDTKDFPGNYFDSDFKNARNFDLTHDLDKAKELWKERKLRPDREPLYASNDIVLRDAILENNATKKTAGLKERDRLRDITKLVDPCKTIEEIKAVSV